MIFPTIDFAIFFVIVFTLNWLTMRHALAWRVMMLLASYVFYGWWDWRFVPLLVLSQIANQASAVAIHRSRTQSRRTWVLVAAVAANLGLLGTFKYYGFFASSIVNALGDLGVEAPVPLVQFVLPVGISFFTFQALSYVIDVYRGDTEPVPVLDFAVHLSFFPQLVAGPIVRANELVPQFAAPRDPRRVDSARAFYLIAVGLFKKVVIADLLARTIVDPVYGAPGQHSALDAIGAIYGYSVQIFCDFSAYTDIAIGVALLLGFVLPENFDSPYTATSARDFWRRWHMTLSRWLRDYLYVPLGGNREARRMTVHRNLMLTMLIGGLWHGASWTFVAWGGLHGAWLVASRIRDRRRAPSLVEGRPMADGKQAVEGRPVIGGASIELRELPARLLVRRVVTFHIVTALWVLFRAESPANAIDVVSRLWSGWDVTPALLSPAVLLAIAFGIGVQYVPARTVDAVQAWFSRLRPVSQGLLLAIVLLLIDALGPEGVASFIYYQF